MKPEVKCIAFAAVTKDGYIARHSKELSDWTSKQDKKHLYDKLEEMKAVVVVGKNTYDVSKLALSSYKCIVFKGSVPYAHRVSDRVAYFNPKTGPDDFIRYCYDHGYRNIAVLGGSHVYTWFLEYGLIDEFYLTTEPCYFYEGIPLLQRGLQLQDTMELQGGQILNAEGAYLEHYVKIPCPNCQKSKQSALI